MFWLGLTAMLLQSKFVNVMLVCYLLSVFVILTVLLLYRLRQNIKSLSSRFFCSLLGGLGGNEVLLKHLFIFQIAYFHTAA